MRIVFFGWRGLNQTKTFRLHGYVDDRRYIEGLSEKDIENLQVVKIDISEAMIDLLEISGAGKWRIPSPAEIEAELDHGDAIEARFR